MKEKEGIEMAQQTEFRRLAKELAAVELQILEGHTYVSERQNVRWENMGKQHSQTVIGVCLGVAVAAVVLLNLIGDGGVTTIVLGVVLLGALLKAYLEWGVYKKQKEKQREVGQVSDTVSDLADRRRSLIGQLNEIRQKMPEKSRRYWWDMNISPKGFNSAKLPGTTVEGWQFTAAFQVTVNERADGLYCEDFYDYAVSVSAEEVEQAMRNGGVAIYRDEEVLSRPHDMFACIHLYAVRSTPIEEITSSTTYTSVDKEAEMEAYREKLDAGEVLMNAAVGDGLLTNREAALYGKRSVSQFGQEEFYRGMAELDRQEKIDAMLDYEENTTYRKTFRNLYKNEFLSCAMVFLSMEENTLGKTALIVLPRQEVSSVTLTVRLDKPKQALSGYLERYMGNEALVMGGHTIRPSIKMAAEQLFGGEFREQLHLKELDILAEKPSGLTDAEWCYLVWQAQRK